MSKKNFREKLIYVRDNYKKIKREIELDSQLTIIKDVKTICRTSIDMYYDAYTPKTYDRYGSLYYAYKIKIIRNDLIISFDPKYIPKVHRVDKENPNYIYDVMFKEGWHGGALNYEHGVSTPYWRKPPYFKEWGERAVKSESPYEIIEHRFNLYAKRRIKNIIINSSNKIFGKYL